MVTPRIQPVKLLADNKRSRINCNAHRYLAFNPTTRLSCDAHFRYPKQQASQAEDRL